MQYHSIMTRRYPSTCTPLRRALIVAACMASLLGSPVQAEEALTVETKTLSAMMAYRVAHAALDACDALGYQVGVSVVGRNGNLIALLRDPLSGPHTINISEKKAFTSVSTRVATSSLSDRPNLNFEGRLLTLMGGLPINLGGYLYGGVGVSGATPEDDEVCAQAGIDAIRDDIEFGE